MNNNEKHKSEQEVKITKNEIFVIIVASLAVLFFVINNLFEYYFIGTGTSFSILFTACTYCILMFVLKRYYKVNERSKRLILSRTFFSLAGSVAGSVVLYLVFGLTVWTKIIILFLWLAVGCFLLFTVYSRNKNN